MREFLLMLSFMRRELRAGVRGFYVFLFCLVLGTGTIAGILSLSEGMMESIRYDGRYILGGDIALRTIYQPASKEQYKFLQKMGAITVVMETRAMARTADDASATMVELKAVDPFYPLYGSMEFEDLDGNVITTPTQDLVLPPASEDPNNAENWGAVVEKELMIKLGLKIGDHISVGSKKFQVRAIIRKEPDRLGSNQFTLAPRVMISSYVFDKTGLSVEGSQVYYSYRILTPQFKTLEEIKGAQEAIEKAFPDATWKGRNFYNALPRAERMINQLTLFFSLIGFSTLLVGGVGISNAVRSFLDAKTSHIATLKCLGASQKFVFRVYLMQILSLATLGILLGLCLGVGVSQLAGALLTDKLSLSDKVGVYGVALAAATAFGYLTTLAFTFWPLGRAVNVKPADLFRDLIAPSTKKPGLNVMILILIAAQALALLAITISPNKNMTLSFIGGALGSFAVFFIYSNLLSAILKKLPRPRLPELRLAIANLYRPGNTSTSIIMSLGIGLCVLVAVALVEFNLSRIMRDDLAQDAPSFFFLDIQSSQKDDFVKMMQEQPSVRNLKVTPSLRGRISMVNGVDAEKAIVDRSEDWVIKSDRGFTYTTDLPAHSDMIEGEWWAADYQGPPIVSIATDVAKAFDIGVGDELTITILGRDITAKVANVRDIDWASFTMNFAVTFAPGALESAPATFIATVGVDENAEIKMQNDIAKNFPNVTAVRVRDALETAGKLLGAILGAIRISAAVTLVAGTLVLAGGIAAARRRHIYDAVVLKVLGATKRRILMTFLLEYGMLGIVTSLVAAVIGTAASYGILTQVMELKWEFSWLSVLTITLVCLGITLASGFAGTLGALRQKPARHLRNQ